MFPAIILASVLGAFFGWLGTKIIESFSEKTLNPVLKGLSLVVSSALCVFSIAFYGLGAKSIFYFLLWWGLFGIAEIDGMTYDIYDVTLYFLGAVAVGAAWVSGVSVEEGVKGFIAGAGFFGLIYLGAILYYKKEAFGLGDVWIMGLSGVVLGVQTTIAAGFFSFYLALLWLIYKKVTGKNFSLDMQIPFAPFIAVAIVVMSVWGNDLVTWYLNGFQ
jgi:prepilin signal peptidase PulO-like enzyme (type II secretory pathway)